jgi:hypothetical protein
MAQPRAQTPSRVATQCTWAAGGRGSGVKRGLLVSGRSCLPTAELPSMSKRNAVSSPDTAMEQAAPQRSHRGRAVHQAELKAISALASSWALRGVQELLVVLSVPRGAVVPGIFSGSALSRCGNARQPNQQLCLKK